MLRNSRSLTMTRYNPPVIFPFTDTIHSLRAFGPFPQIEADLFVTSSRPETVDPGGKHEHRTRQSTTCQPGT